MVVCLGLAEYALGRSECPLAMLVPAITNNYNPRNRKRL